SPGRASRRAGRHIDQPRRLPLRGEGGETAEHDLKPQTEELTMSKSTTSDVVADTARPGTDEPNLSRRNILLAGTTLAAASAIGAATAPQTAQAQQPAASSGQRPNILVIWGDDVGIANVSAYSFGVMGYKTPNIDRIAREGLMFTDYYAEQGCTAGRA